MADPETLADHLQLWMVNEIPFTTGIGTKGQFDPKAKSRTIGSLTHVANPVSKDDGPIRFPDRHYTGYAVTRFTVPDIARHVVFSNQFSVHTDWDLGDPALLLVPAGKSLPPDDPAAPDGPTTHYLCYEAKGPMVVRGVRLSDQFTTKLDTSYRHGPLFPAYFGVPVEKNGEPIGNDQVHYAIYAFQAYGTGLPMGLPLNYTDQFTSGSGQALVALMLAVPSTKLEWNPI